MVLFIEECLDKCILNLFMSLNICLLYHFTFLHADIIPCNVISAFMRMFVPARFIGIFVPNVFNTAVVNILRCVVFASLDI